MITKKKDKGLSIPAIAPVSRTTDYYENVPEKYIKNGYVLVGQYMNDVNQVKPAKPTPKDLKLQKDLEAWEAKYWHFLKRKNKFYDKLVEASRNPNTSKKYAELRAEVDKYHSLMRSNNPQFNRNTEN